MAAIGVYIGRFQPLHMGHVDIIYKALENVEKLIVLIGSTQSSRTIQNPFTYEERKHFFELCFESEIERGKIVIAPIRDYFYDDAVWVNQVKTKVQSLIDPRLWSDITLIGCKKPNDTSTYYLDLFHPWGCLEFNMEQDINATKIRKDYYHSRFWDYDVLPRPLYQELKAFKETDNFQALEIENDFCEEYTYSWKDAPFPPVFVTVDVLLHWRGQIVLIRRKDHPGKDKVALPGGFIDINENLNESAMRELKEETGIKDLKIDTASSYVFDYPKRSSRGRVITHCYWVDISKSHEVRPEVQAGDDAKEVFWCYLNELPAMQKFHDDHFQIIECVLNYTDIDLLAKLNCKEGKEQ